MFDQLTLDTLSARFLIGGLFFIRISGLIVSAPFFRNLAIPIPVKVFFSVILATILTSAYGDKQPPIEFEAFNLVFLAFKEFLTGAILGFSMDLVFQGVRYAGGLIDFDMGYFAASLFDAESTTPSLIGELKATVALIIFLIINGHHFLIESLFLSARIVPINTFVMSGSTERIIISLVASSTVIAFKIAAPVLVSLFLANLGLALLARVAPQTNIFILSFTMKIVVGLLVLLAATPLMIMIIKQSLIMFENETMKLLSSLNPGSI